VSDAGEADPRWTGAQRLLVAGPLEIVRAHARHVLLAGVVAGLLVGPWAPWIAVAVAAVAGLVLRRAVLGLALMAAVLAGATVAELRLEALDRTSLGPLLGREVQARAVLLEAPRVRANGVRVVPARLLEVSANAAAPGEAASGGDGAGERVLLRVREGQGVEANWPDDPTGAVVAVGGRLRALPDVEAHERRRGAHAELRVRRLRPTGARRGGLSGALDGARRRAEAALSAGVPDERAGLARGMVLGQGSALDPALEEAFRVAGLSHLVAASGTNVALLAALVAGLGALLAVPLRVRLLVALAAIAAYVPLAGAGPSIQRAGVMGAAVLVAALAGRTASRAYALLLAAAVTLVLNPRAPGDVGWQLSFAAVLALVAAGPGLTRALARAVPLPLATTLAVTLAATAGTAPLVALHFERLSVVSVVANVLAAPAVPLVMWLGAAAAAIGQVAPAVAELPATVAALPLGYLAWLATAAAELPGAEAKVTAPSPLLVAAAYGLAAAAVLAGWERRRRRAVAALLAGEGADDPTARRLMREGPDAGADPASPRPGRWGGAEDPPGLRAPGDLGGEERRGGRLLRALRAQHGQASGWRPVVTTILAAAALLAAVALLRPPPPAPPAHLRVSFLDVGQGDATLVQHGAHAVLVDAGPPHGGVLRHLRAAGVRRLDVLVLTHASLDHDGAAADVLRALDVGLVLDGAEANARTPGNRAARAVARARRIPVAPSDAGQVLTAGPIRAHVLSPDRERPAPPGTEPNLRATVLHVRDGAFDLLLSADAESDTLSRLRLPDVDAMKVPHHGSADPGLPDVLARLRPEVAVIPVGPNAYGHPTRETLRALRVVPTVRRTDRDGTVRVEVGAGGLEVRALR